jgi:hypothetical protein
MLSTYQMAHMLRSKRRVLYALLRRFGRCQERADHAVPLIGKNGADQELGTDPGPERVIVAGIGWLCRAQDCSKSNDGGVAHNFSMLQGWADSYPETTGYIVGTLLSWARMNKDEDIRRRAKHMLDWLTSIQLPNGGFQGGVVTARPTVPVTFNTGQVLMGLVNGVEEFGDEYRASLCRAGDWLVQTQERDGCWRKFPTPFAESGEKTYDAHVAWSLVEADGIDPARGYADAAVANIRWVLRHQRSNGWFAKCCLDDPGRPLTHTIGYALRGVFEVYRYTHIGSFLAAAERCADGVMQAVRPDGFLAGRLDSAWKPAVPWVCLTGSAQIASCLLLLYRETGKRGYLQVARKMNAFVRRTVRLDGPEGMQGGVQGSFPLSGEYATDQYPNWACKFMIDANLLELDLVQKSRAA